MYARFIAGRKELGGWGLEAPAGFGERKRDEARSVLWILVWLAALIGRDSVFPSAGFLFRESPFRTGHSQIRRLFQMVRRAG